tara:strand:+ start:2679 stop:3149 length:471 start_codon:yes stop_codon:yes gene_type:complete
MSIPVCDLPEGENDPNKMSSHQLHLAEQMAALVESGRWIFLRGMSMVKDCGDHHAVSIASGTYVPDSNGEPWLPDLSCESTRCMLIGVVRRVYGSPKISSKWSVLGECWIVVKVNESGPWKSTQIGHGRWEEEAILMALRNASDWAEIQPEEGKKK